MLCSLLQLKQSKPTRGPRSEHEEASRNFEEHLEKGEHTKGCLEKGAYPKACLEKGSQRKGKLQKLEKVGGPSRRRSKPLLKSTVMRKLVLLPWLKP